MDVLRTVALSGMENGRIAMVHQLYAEIKLEILSGLDPMNIAAWQASCMIVADQATVVGQPVCQCVSLLGVPGAALQPLPSKLQMWRPRETG